jgi:hypothetical protein
VFTQKVFTQKVFTQKVFTQKVFTQKVFTQKMFTQEVFTQTEPALSPRYFFRVAAAFFAERDREAFDRFLAAARACRESASFEAELRPSRFSALRVARERFVDLVFLPALRRSRLACVFVSSELVSDGGNSTPARRAFDKPIAIACLVERAPCLPSRMCSISSRTNSPA